MQGSFREFDAGEKIIKQLLKDRGVVNNRLRHSLVVCDMPFVVCLWNVDVVSCQAIPIRAGMDT